MNAARVLNSIVLCGRRLTISAPDATAEPANLLIIHDGQNLDAWRAVETVAALTASGAIAPTLIAAIDHTGERRIREFGYGAAGYARFVARDVVPYVRGRYAVRRDRMGTWLCGSSMGGLVTLQTAALHTDLFGKLFVLSPSVWWNRRAILRAIRRPGMLGGLFSRSSGLRADADIWLSIGLKEGDTAIADARRLRDTILDMRLGDASRLRYFEDPDGEHSESSWARQLERALANDPSAG
ncbi:MAG: esterase family protein [Acidobacteria bacterium]|nr:MAG: esterase family protein [Acidobacteriota bacterium]